MIEVSVHLAISQQIIKTTIPIANRIRKFSPHILQYRLSKTRKAHTFNYHYYTVFYIKCKL